MAVGIEPAAVIVHRPWVTGPMRQSLVNETYSLLTTHCSRKLMENMDVQSNAAMVGQTEAVAHRKPVVVMFIYHCQTYTSWNL